MRVCHIVDITALSLCPVKDCVATRLQKVL
jgi:hypothetical protein